MRSDHSIAALCAAFVVSVLLHLLIVLPWLMSTMTQAAGPPDPLRSALDPEELDEREKEVDLGIDTATTPSLTWIGYEEYEEHLARLSEAEQAAMTDAPPGETIAGARPAPIFEERAAQTEETGPPHETIEPAAAMTDQTSEALVMPETSAIPRMEDVPDPFDDFAIPVSERPEIVNFLGPLVLQPSELIASPLLEPVEDQAPVTKPSETAEQSEQPSPSTIQTPGDQPGDPDGRPGDPAEKEADPTSLVEVPPDRWKTGKPIARRGLELFPKRPHFTTLTLLTAVPRNPLCRMHIDRSGRVVRAEILKSSGDSRVDSAILSSLFAWRAKGEQLESLSGEATLQVTIRIVFVPGRDAS